MNKYILLLLPILFNLSACKKGDSEASSNTLFTKMPSDKTGIKFINKLDYDKDFNIYKYRNFYNGGGVAIGDINNDGLPDVYMSSNMHHNKLYLNKGNMQFEDITEKAGVAGTKSWATGVTMADINGDGLLDIYVCNSGDIKGGTRENELFINTTSLSGGQGGITFEEKAHEYGLDDKGLSTHAAFFDYDKDGDLDCYLLNNSFRAIGSFNLQKNLRNTRDSLGGHKLFRNDGPLSFPPSGGRKGGFTDVSAQAGIYGSVQAFGLGVMVGDVAGIVGRIFMSVMIFLKEIISTSIKKMGLSKRILKINLGIVVRLQWVLIWLISTMMAYPMFSIQRCCLKVIGV